MKRRMFLKLIGLGSASLPIIASAKPEVYQAKDVKVFIGDKEIIPFEDIKISLPPQHYNCRCVQKPLNKYLDGWAELTGVCRKPGETDDALRIRVIAKRKGN